MGDKYTERGIVILKKETQVLSEEIVSLNNQKKSVAEEIKEEQSKLNNLRASVASFTDSIAVRLQTVALRLQTALDNVGKTEDIVRRNKEEILKTESIISTLKSSITHTGHVFEVPIFVKETLHILKEQLASFAGRWETEENALSEKRKMRFRIEKAISDSLKEYNEVATTLAKVRAEIATLQSLKNKEEKDNGHISDALDAQIIERLAFLATEEVKVTNRRNFLRDESVKYKSVLSNIQKEISSIEIPEQDFSYERQVASQILAQINDLELRKEVESEEVLRLSQLRSETQEYVESLLTEKYNLIKEVKTYKEEKENIAENNAMLENAILEHGAKISVLSEELNSIVAAIHEAGLERQIAEFLLKKNQKELAVTSNVLESAKTEYTNLQKEKENMKSDITTYTQDLERLRSEISLGNDKNGKMGLELLSIEDKLVSLRNRERSVAAMEKRLRPEYQQFLSGKLCRKCGTII